MAAAKRTCTFPGCEGKYQGGGLCQGHYAQRRRGKALSTLNPSVSERLAKYSDRSGECWIWTAALNQYGYGVISVKRRSRLAHRVAYELAYGKIPAELVLDHKCLTPACVRPDHLQAVAQSLNTQNFSGLTSANTSGVRGVSWHRGHHRWVARVNLDGVSHYVGKFKDIRDAEAAVLKRRLELHTNNLVDRGLDLRHRVHP